MSTYTVRYERGDGGYWLAEVVEVPGCRTQARNLPSVEERIREALGLFVNDADEADLVGQVVLPARTLEQLSTYHEAREQSEAWREEADRTLHALLRSLAGKAQLSTRDIGWLLGLSAQRVSQLTKQHLGAKKRA